MKRFFSIVSAVGLLIMMIAGCTSTTPAFTPDSSGKINLTQGSTSSASASFVFAVAVSQVINKYVPSLNVTVVESGATYDNLRRMKDGMFDFSTSMGNEGLFEQFYGLSTFKGQAWPETRAFFLQEYKVYRMYVTQKSGVKTWADLAGKKFAPGIPGSASSDYIVQANDVLGTKVDLQLADLADVLDSIGAGRVAGVDKSSPITGFEAGVLNVHLTNPMTAIGFTEAESAKLKAKFPYWIMNTTPKGTIKEAPEFTGIERYFMALAATTSRMPQQIGYEIAKAVTEHWSEITNAYTSGKVHKNPLSEYFPLIPKEAAVPVHAGVVQYCKEVGIAVPEWFIPPEYKAK